MNALHSTQSQRLTQTLPSDDGRLFSRAAARLAADLRTESGLLERDARAFEVRGFPRLAADLRVIRDRLVAVARSADGLRMRG